MIVNEAGENRDPGAIVKEIRYADFYPALQRPLSAPWVRVKRYVTYKGYLAAAGSFGFGYGTFLD